jgi:hypothetical protein
MRTLVILLAVAGTASADRAAHLRSALATFSALGPAGRSALDLELYDAVRTKCRAGSTRPTATCMADAGKTVCGARPDRAACLAAADVILTNQHAEGDLLDDVTRMKLLRGSTDYHAAVNAELWKTYALLAAELALAPQGTDRADQIHAFCAGRDRTVHACEPGAKGCVPSLAYQRCAAALVWFVAGEATP